MVLMAETMLLCHSIKQYCIQAGAELCQAQFKLGLAKPVLKSTALRLSSISILDLSKNGGRVPCITDLRFFSIH